MGSKCTVRKDHFILPCKPLEEAISRHIVMLTNLTSLPLQLVGTMTYIHYCPFCSAKISSIARMKGKK